MDWKRLNDLTRHHGRARVEAGAMDGIDLSELARLALAEAQRTLANANNMTRPNLNAVFAARDRVDEELAAWNAIYRVEDQRAARSGW